MNLIFFGTSDYCLPVLESLHANFDLQLVVTRPDKPIGRKKVLTPSATKLWAQQHNVPTFTPETLKMGTQERSELNKLIGQIKPDLAIVSDFGLIIPEGIFNQPRLGTLNVHFSKLPDLRGPSPVQNTLLRGDTTAWVTIFKLENPPELEIKMDSGPILWQQSFAIAPNDTTQSLYTKLFQEVAKELPDIIKPFALSLKPLLPQDHSHATFCGFLAKEDGFIDLDLLQTAQNGGKVSLTALPEIQQIALKSKGKEDYGELHSAQHVFNFFRGVTPWPGMWTLRDEKRMKILACHLSGKKLVLDQIQFEGKNPTSVDANSKFISDGEAHTS